MEKKKMQPRIMVDASHKNAHGGYKGQMRVIQDIYHQIVDENSRLIQSIMMESHLQEGQQSVANGRQNPHQSITDGCIGKTDTLKALDLLDKAAEYKRATA